MAGKQLTSSFDSPQEEAAHYREKYRRILDMLDETRAELGMSTATLFHGTYLLIILDEFQASSKELEDELEKELAATEKQQTDLREKIKRLEGEKEDWKVCYKAFNRVEAG